MDGCRSTASHLLRCVRRVGPTGLWARMLLVELKSSACKQFPILHQSSFGFDYNDYKQ